MKIRQKFLNINNNISFKIRNYFKWRRGCPELRNEGKNNLFDFLSCQQQVLTQKLADKYYDEFELANLYKQSSRIDYRDNLYLIHQLNLLFDLSQFDESYPSPRILDIGCKNWHYVFGLHQFFKKRLTENNQLNLFGVEVDSFIIYSDFYSRADYAEAYLKQISLSKSHYFTEDFLTLKIESLDIITIFYPFLALDNQINWGLPIKFYKPESIFEQIKHLLKSQGILIAFTHTLEEAHNLEIILEKLSFEILAKNRLKPEFISYGKDTLNRTGFLVKSKI